jgi:hypothetical protein
MSNPPSSQDARPRLRIGVTGHRAPPKLLPHQEGAIRAGVDRILATVRTAMQTASADSASPPRDGQTHLVIVSALAEGADRIVAHAGLDSGASLLAVLPFPRQEYALDFETAASRDDYQHLLSRASLVIELDGKRDQAPSAYEGVGLTMLDHSDLLIAIWDGKAAAGLGGTSEIVAAASNKGIPVLVLNPAQPEPIIFGPVGISRSNRTTGDDRLRKEISALVKTIVDGHGSANSKDGMIAVRSEDGSDGTDE